MHIKHLEMMENNKERVQVLEEKVLYLEQCIKDLDINYDKIYKFMLEKTKVIREL